MVERFTLRCWRRIGNSNSFKGKEKASKQREACGQGGGRFNTWQESESLFALPLPLEWDLRQKEERKVGFCLFLLTLDLSYH